MDRVAAELITDIAVFVTAGATVKFSGTTPADAQLIAAFVRWAMGSTTANVTLKARKRMKRGYGGHAVQRASSYLIHFLANDLRASLVLLAHEVTHVLQYERGDLKHTKTHIVWKGKPFITIGDYNTISQPDHAKLPWEKEAADAEGRLPTAFINAMKKRR